MLNVNPCAVKPLAIKDKGSWLLYFINDCAATPKGCWFSSMRGLGFYDGFSGEIKNLTRQTERADVITTARSANAIVKQTVLYATEIKIA